MRPDPRLRVRALTKSLAGPPGRAPNLLARASSAVSGLTTGGASTGKCMKAVVVAASAGRWFRSRDHRVGAMNEELARYGDGGPDVIHGGNSGRVGRGHQGGRPSRHLRSRLCRSARSSASAMTRENHRHRVVDPANTAMPVRACASQPPGEVGLGTLSCWSSFRPASLGLRLWLDDPCRRDEALSVRATTRMIDDMAVVPEGGARSTVEVRGGDRTLA